MIHLTVTYFSTIIYSSYSCFLEIFPARASMGLLFWFFFIAHHSSTVSSLFFLPLEVFPGDSDGKNLPAMQETWVWSLDWENPLKKRMAIHSSILAWRIPWTEGPDGYSPWSLKESDTTNTHFFLSQSCFSRSHEFTRKHMQQLWRTTWDCSQAGGSSLNSPFSH